MPLGSIGREAQRDGRGEALCRDDLLAQVEEFNGRAAVFREQSMHRRDRENSRDRGVYHRAPRVLRVGIRAQQSDETLQMVLDAVMYFPDAG